jgi:hypothetical protein
VTVLLILVLVLPAAGCAERMTKSRYEEEVGKLMAERTKILNELPTHDGTDVQYFARSQESIQQGASDLDRLQPPKEAEQAHEMHVEGMRGLARLLGKLADCARLAQRDAGAGRTCRDEINQLELDEVRNDFFEADTIYEEHGYKFGS